MDKKVTLYKFKSENIDISMELYFDEKNQLIFDGYDIGKKVEEIWGDSDFEYIASVSPKEVSKLFILLGIEQDDKSSLLKILQDKFSGNKAYSRFLEFLNKNDIEYSYSTWT